MNVGIIGCGAISGTYIVNIKQHFGNVEVLSCSDIFSKKAQEISKKYGIPKAYSTEEMLADPEVDIVLNLTIPAAHYEITKAALEAGKHVYSEKPLAPTVEEAVDLVRLAEEKGLRIGCAPDSFLGPPIQTAKKLIDEGRLGDIVGFSAWFASPGPELWHPNPGFLYEYGAGPMEDMGPYYITALVALLGPVTEVYCKAKKGFPTRNIKGAEKVSEVNTNYSGVLSFGDISGCINMSFDTWHHEHPRLEIYGTKGMMEIPDPDDTGGEVQLFDSIPFIEEMKKQNDIHSRIDMMYGERKLKYYNPVSNVYNGGVNMRGTALDDMAHAISDGRPHRATGGLAVHLVEVIGAFDKSAETGLPIKIEHSCECPDAFYPIADSIWKNDDGNKENKFEI